MNRSHLRIVIGLIFCMLFSLSLFAQAPPSADTFVSSSTPKTNYGPGITLVVGSGSTSYLQFNLSGIPAGATVSKATLRLYVDAVVKGGSFDVYQVNNNWGENTLTYSTPAPLLGASVTGGHPISISSASWNQFLLIDVTSLVQGWVNGSIANNGLALALTNGSSGYFSFDSKESLLTGNGPELEIGLSGTPGAQGPPGPQGPAGAQGTQGATGPQGPQGQIGPAGPQGATGAQGLQGPPGVDGAQGPQGPQGAAGQGFNFRAAFDNTASYAAYDVVSFNGSTYNAKAATNPGDPAPDVNPNWSVMAQQGAAGPAGAAGPQGPLGPVGPVGPPGPIPPNAAVTTAANTFAASQTVNGNLILGAGGAIQFSDGSTQNTATAGSAIPPGYIIQGVSPVAPAGYTLLGATASGNVWGPQTSMPAGDYGLAAAAVNGKIYTVGGFNDPNEFQVYDPIINSWSFATPMPTPRSSLAAAALNGKIYAIGGLNGSTPVATVEVYDLPSGSWGTAAPMNVARYGLAAVATNGMIYAIGGTTGNGVALATIERYDPSTNTWVQEPSGLITPRLLLAAATVDGEIFVIGGCDGQGTALNAVEMYDPITFTSFKAPSLPTASCNLAAASVPASQKIYAVGGVSGLNLLANVAAYDVLTNTWSSVEPLPYATSGLAATTVDSNPFLFYAVGGRAIGGAHQFVGLLELYSPATTLYTFVKN